MRSRAELEECAVACCHCGIRFLTNPRNKGRADLRCPFGCRRHHRRQLANARSRKYSRTPRGARNKKRHNNRRGQGLVDRQSPPAPPAASRVDASLATGAVAPPCDPPREEASLPLEGLVLDERILRRSCTLSYLAMLVSLLERTPVDRRSVLRMLRQCMRRRSMGRIARREYVLRYLQEHPPPGDHDEPIGGTNEP